MESLQNVDLGCIHMAHGYVGEDDYCCLVMDYHE